MLRSVFELRWQVLLMALACVPAQAQRPLGTDVSSYQPNVNWTTVKNAGVTFAWTKATEGTWYIDPYFDSHVAGAIQAGIYVGAYHYAHPGTNPNLTGPKSADTEAAYFWNVAGKYIKNGGGYLVPMLDWEDTDATVSNGFTAAGLSAWVNEWCMTVSNYAAADGVIIKPVVYTGGWYSTPGGTYPGLTSAVNGWPNWMANYNGQNPQTGAPFSTYPWPFWQIWQYADTNWSGGDADVFNGDLAGFIQTFVIGAVAPGIVQPGNLVVAQGKQATFTCTHLGSGSFNYQWRFNGVPIPGATAAICSITNVQLTNVGGYSVKVSTTNGSAVSSPAFLLMLSPLTNAANSVLAPAGMVNWWPTDGNLQDIYGAQNATPINALAFTSGEVNLALKLNGTNSYARVPGVTNLPPPWSLCLWVNRRDAPGASAALMGDGVNVLKLEQYHGTRQVGVTLAGVADYLFSPGCAVPTNLWTHLAFVGTSNSVHLFVNGALAGTVSVTNFPLARACLGADLLGGSPTDFLAGRLDEVQVFNRALAPAEVNAIWQAGQAGLVRAPQFTGATVSSDGQVQFFLRGQTGKPFIVYTAPDFVNWVLLGTFANPTGATSFIDSAQSKSQRFYRALQW